MALFPKFAKVAGITFKHGIGSRVGQQSALALARRGLLNEVMLKKIPLPQGIAGKASGLPWGIQVLAKGRKRVHPLGWVPDDLLAKGYGKDVLFGAESKAAVFYRGQKSQNFGMRFGLPGEAEFMGGAAASSKGPIVGLGLGAAVAGTLLFSLLAKGDKEEAPLSNSLGKAHMGSGFPELGLGPMQRKTLTDFGSGFNPIKAIARKVGLTPEALIKSKEFQTALRNPITDTTGKYATRSFTAGAGSESVLQRWGEMSLPVKTSKGTIQGKFKFPFVEKKAHTGEMARIEAIATNRASAIKPNIPTGTVSKTQLNTFPDLYGLETKSGRVFSESLPGVTFDRYLSEIKELRPKIGITAAMRRTTDKYKLPYTSIGQIEKDIDAFRNQMRIVHKQTGLTHGDLSAGNVMLTPHGISAIDWAQPRALTRKLASKSKTDVFEQMTERYGTMSAHMDPDVTPRYISMMRREHPQVMAALEGPVAGFHRASWQREQGLAMGDLALKNLKGRAKIMSEAIPAQELKKFDWRLETSIDYMALDDLKATVQELKKSHRFTTPGLANRLEGMPDGGVASSLRQKMTDFGSPWQGPVVSEPMAEGMMAPTINNEIRGEGAKLSSMMIEGGFAPTSPELEHIAKNMPQAGKAAISQGSPATYMQNNVPLSTKIKIRGTSNGAGHVGNLANMVAANIPKSKVNINVQDHRTKLTPQRISDMMEG
jgi:hypothetical protein